MGQGGHHRHLRRVQPLIGHGATVTRIDGSGCSRKAASVSWASRSSEMATAPRARPGAGSQPGAQLEIAPAASGPAPRPAACPGPARPARPVARPRASRRRARKAHAWRGKPRVAAVSAKPVRSAVNRAGASSRWAVTRSRCGPPWSEPPSGGPRRIEPACLAVERPERHRQHGPLRSAPGRGSSPPRPAGGIEIDLREVGLRGRCGRAAQDAAAVRALQRAREQQADVALSSKGGRGPDQTAGVLARSGGPPRPRPPVQRRQGRQVMHLVDDKQGAMASIPPGAGPGQRRRPGRW